MIGRIFPRLFAIYLVAKLTLRTRSRIALSVFIDRNSRFEGRNAVGRGTILAGSAIGFATFVGADCSLANCRIGRYCSIAHQVEILPYVHPTERFVSTHPAFYSLLKQSGFTYATEQLFEERRALLTCEGSRTVEIGNDVWVGAHVLLLGGVRVGDGAVIAAGSIVTKDVPPYAIVAGSPARVIRMRFDETGRAFLAKLRWWDKPTCWLQANAPFFADIRLLSEQPSVAGVTESEPDAH